MRFEEQNYERSWTEPWYLGACVARLAQPPASVDAICDDELPDLRRTE